MGPKKEMEMDAKHTPLPWHVFYKNGVLSVYGEKNDDVVHWAGFDSATCDEKQKLANALFIVRAVNSHESLLAACNELLSELADKSCCSVAELSECGWGKRALDAVALAEGGAK